MTTRTPLVGILGGMGPAATTDFYAKLIAATPARTDQDHLRVVIWADPTVPDRTAALTEDGADPTPKLVDGVRQLAAAGADFYVVACNGAHAYLPRVREQVDLPYLSMIDVTAERARGHATAGVVATSGTLAAGLYQDGLAAVGVTPLLPDDVGQKAVMEAIYAVKASTLGRPERHGLLAAIEALADRGATVIIAGCTEIPLALDGLDVRVPVLDPAQLLADRVVAEVAHRSTHGI